MSVSALGMAKLPTRPPTLKPIAYENVCKSRGTSVRLKRDYLAAIAACGNDAGHAEREHSAFVLGKARSGDKVADLLPDEGLGAFVELNNFIKYNARAFSRSIAALRRQTDAMLAYYDKREKGLATTETERLATRSFMNATVPVRADGNVWLFRNPTGHRDAYHGIPERWLAHRLGLDVAASGETRLTFGFAAAHVRDVRYPTFCDTSWLQLPQWDWRCITRPLTLAPRGTNGLAEVVAQPPMIDRTNRPILAIDIPKR